MKYLATIRQSEDKPTLQFENRELFQKYLKENIGKEIILDIKLNKTRSNKQNSLYWQVVACYGAVLFHTESQENASKYTHDLLKDIYCAYELKQEPIIKKVGLVEKTFYNFSISFDKLDNIEANKYYEWAFEFILEVVNKDRDVKLVDIMDYVEECKRGNE